MQGAGLAIIFVLSIVVMILAISKFKIHPFLAIMGISLLLGLLAGIPLVDKVHEDGTVTQGLANVIGAGFSGTFTSIGIVIILGALIGSILEVTGGAVRLADMIIKLVGHKRPELAILLMGWVVSIPVFCDSGFVILNPIRKAMAKETKTSSVAMTVALSTGLYASHVFIPPTPGPIAAANTLGVGDNLLMVMGFGALCSIPALIASYFFAKYIGKKVKSMDEINNDEIKEEYEDIIMNRENLPNGFLSIAPIIMPIIFMAIGSITNMAKLTGSFADLLRFLGTPIIALTIGTIFGVILLYSSKTIKEFYKITDNTLRTVGPILFVTAAGGVLGKVIAVSGLVQYITDNVTVLQAIGIFFPFIVSAILKTSQGSSTVALTTTAGIMAPMMTTLALDTPVLRTLTVMAIAAGAMTVSHANDSYFWVVTNFGELKVEDGYKTQTAATLIEGLVSMGMVFILWMIFK